MTPEERFTRIENTLSAITEHQAKFDERQAHTDLRIERLTEAMLKIAEAQDRTDGEIDRIVEAQKATDHKLNILIDTVDKVVRGRP